MLNGSLGPKVITCQKCQLIQTSPRPLVESSCSEELYQNKDYFAGARDNCDLWYRMQMPIIEDVAKVKSAGKWLDIGSGLGFLPAVAKQAGYDANGIDLNESVVAEGVKQYAHPVSVTDLGQIADNEHDIVSLNHVLEHVESPREFLSLAAMKLKPGGILVVGVPDIKGGVPRLIRFFNRLRLRVGSKWLWHGYQLEQHLWHFTPESLIAQVPNDLKVIKVTKNDNMYYGFLEQKKWRYQILALAFNLFKLLEMGDNLRIILQKEDA